MVRSWVDELNKRRNATIGGEGSHDTSPATEEKSTTEGVPLGLPTNNEENDRV